MAALLWRGKFMRAGSYRKTLTLAFLASFQIVSFPLAVEAVDIQNILVTLADVDARQAQLEKRVADALSSGRLTTGEATNFKRELDRIQENEASFRATNGLSAWELLRLSLDLDNFSKSLELQMHDRQVPTSDVTARRLDIEKRVAEGQSNGRLTDFETQELKRELSRITALESHFRIDSLLSADETLTLSLDLDRLSARLERQLAERPSSYPDLDERWQEVAKSVDEGIAAGKLTANQATDFKTELTRLESLKRMYRESGDALTLEEALNVGLDLDRLSGRVDLALKNPLVATDVDARQSDLDRRIASGITSGRLTPQEAVELQREYERIATLESTMRSSGNLLTYEESAHLSLDLERLASRIERALHEPNQSWLGIAAVQTGLSRRIADARASGRLTAAEAQILRSEFDRLAAIDASQRATADGLTASEAVLLSIDFQRLSARIDRTLHDREIALLPFGGRQAEVDRRIAEGIVIGKLTPAQARELKAEFDRIASLEASYLVSDSRLDSRELLQLSYDLERLAARAERLLRDSQTNEGIAVLRTRVESAVTSAYASGALTASERQQFLSDYDRIKNSEQTYRSSGGMLSTEEALSLVSDLNKLAFTVEQEAKQSVIAAPNIEKRRTELELRISKGLTTGHLTIPEARMLRGELDRIAQEEEKERRSDGGLSYGEAMNLALQLERLAGKIEQQMRDQQIALPNIEQRLNSLEMQIAAALVSGKLTAQEAQTARVGLDEVVTLDGRFKASGGGLSYAESVALSTDVDRLAADIQRTLQAKQTTGADLDSRQLTLEKRINDALRSRQINPTAANSLLDELDRVAESEAAFRISDEGINYMEALTLSLDLDRIQTKIERALERRDTASGANITYRKAQLERRLRAGIESGRIRARQAALLNQEMERISRMESRFRYKGRLTAGETAALSAELDRLKAKIEQQFVYREAR
jgi:hypothetical protein